MQTRASLLRSPLRLVSSIGIALLCGALTALAQGPGGPGAGGTRGERGGGGMMVMGSGSSGQVTAINGDSLTIKTMTGDVLTVKTTAETRVMDKTRNIGSLKDIKLGDYVMAAGGGEAVNGVLQPRFLAVLDEAAQKRIQEFQANLGKTVIAGEVKGITDTKLTILRPDGKTQDIELDEGTSLRRGRDESITLADVKPGDRVFGQGALKNGVFVPTELRVMTPGMRRGGRERGEGAPPPAGAQGPTTNPAPQEPPK
jgi:hypothetical protein